MFVFFYPKHFFLILLISNKYEPVRPALASKLLLIYNYFNFSVYHFEFFLIHFKQSFFLENFKKQKENSPKFQDDKNKELKITVSSEKVEEKEKSLPIDSTMFHANNWELDVGVSNLAKERRKIQQERLHMKNQFLIEKEQKLREINQLKKIKLEEESQQKQSSSKSLDNSLDSDGQRSKCTLFYSENMNSSLICLKIKITLDVALS